MCYGLNLAIDIHYCTVSAFSDVDLHCATDSPPEQSRRETYMAAVNHIFVASVVLSCLYAKISLCFIAVSDKNTH